MLGTFQMEATLKSQDDMEYVRLQRRLNALLGTSAARLGTRSKSWLRSPSANTGVTFHFLSQEPHPLNES